MSYSFHCPADLLDDIYGGSNNPVGSQPVGSAPATLTQTLATEGSRNLHPAGR